MNLSLLVELTRPYRRSLALAGGLMLCESAATLALPWFGGQFVAGVLTVAEIEVGGIVMLLLALFALQGMFHFLTAYVLSRTTAGLLADLRSRIYDRLTSLPLTYFQGRRQGDILAHLTYEAPILSNFCTGTLLNFLPLLLTALGAMVLMFRIEPQLAALVVLLVPAFYLLLRLIGRRLRPLSERLRQAEGTAVAIARDGLSVLPVIKAFNSEAFEQDRYAAQMREAMQLSFTVHRIYAVLRPLTQFLVAAAVLLLLALASGRVNSGDMPPAELVSFLLYAALLTRPVAALSGVYGQVQMARGQLRRLQSVMEERPEPLFEGRDLGPVEGEISFQGVRFTHAGRLATLDGVDLHIRAGETVALTGENGAGKTTLVNLLLRFHEPDAGRILIDGVDISTVSLASLRAQIGLVPQNVLLLHGSIRENIAYGTPDATFDEIQKAARLAQAHRFITDLPQGYDTQIGTEGMQLSGGQRHRLALARALLKDPPILILDEVTAMFDPEGERSFVEDARTACENRTVILITHRPASLQLADRIVTLERGRVVASRDNTAGRGAPIAAGAGSRQ